MDLVEELGGSRVAYCSLDGRELAVALPPGDENLDGTTVWLTFPVGTLHGFDRVTGKRLDLQFTDAQNHKAIGQRQQEAVPTYS